MARNLSRLSPLFRWQYLRWGLVLPALPLALWACNSHDLKEPLPNPQMETDFNVLVSPEREVDILFMVDNSPSMDPKQQALANNFPKMINILQQLPDPSGGTSLPDVHIGVISSDMGAGSVGAGGSGCQRQLGDKGLLWGNDPNNLTASIAPNSLYGMPDPTDPQRPVITDGCGLQSGQRWISDVANANGVGRTQNYAGTITDVFSCMAKAVYVNGCGYEHQLQSVRLALTPQPNVNMENIGFVRPKAYLAIVIITDEDDCSADPADADPAGTTTPGHNNDGMFSQHNPGDTGSLKCAARGHVCGNLGASGGGDAIPNYDPTIGYGAPDPNNATPFTHAFSDCAPKDQKDPSHPDPSWLPLIRVQEMIDYVSNAVGYSRDANGNFLKDSNGNYVTVQKTPDKILVSGIIGWPPVQTLSSVQTTDQYRIDKDTSSIGDQAKLWDYMPICWRTDPASKSADGNTYKAYGGLRLKKFLDAFQKTDPQNGSPVPNIFSICNNDFTDAMTQIGTAIAQALRPGCVNYKLIDTDPNTKEVQPDCQVVDRTLCDVGTPGCLGAGYTENHLPECKDGSGNPLYPPSPDLNSVPDSARPCWYLVYNTDPKTGCPNAPNGQTIAALRPNGVKAPAGTSLVSQCLTCSRPDGNCPSWSPK
jgi:hypothetical protein